MANEKKPALGASLRHKSSGVLAALLCILIGMAIGLVVLFVINPGHAWKDGFLRIVQGGFYDFPYGVGKTLTNFSRRISKELTCKTVETMENVISAAE